jgi:histidinol dehydrogenase
MRIIDAKEFRNYWESQGADKADDAVDAFVRSVIEDVRREGDAAVRRYASRFDKSSPENFAVPREKLVAALGNLRKTEPDLVQAMELAAEHIRDFACAQKQQLVEFEYEVGPGLFAGQRVVPVEKAAVYVPAGRFPLVSSVLMGVVPGLVAGSEVLVASPPLEYGDRKSVV